jgi:hypothetical protein
VDLEKLRIQRTEADARNSVKPLESGLFVVVWR